MQSFLMPGIVCDVSMYLCMGDVAIAACEAIEITEPGFSTLAPLTGTLPSDSNPALGWGPLPAHLLWFGSLATLFL